VASASLKLPVASMQACSVCMPRCSSQRLSCLKPLVLLSNWAWILAWSAISNTTSTLDLATSIPKILVMFTPLRTITLVSVHLVRIQARWLHIPCDFCQRFAPKRDLSTPQALGFGTGPVSRLFCPLHFFYLFYDTRDWACPVRVE